LKEKSPRWEEVRVAPERLGQQMRVEIIKNRVNLLVFQVEGRDWAMSHLENIDKMMEPDDLRNFALGKIGDLLIGDFPSVKDLFALGKSSMMEYPAKITDIGPSPRGYRVSRGAGGQGLPRGEVRMHPLCEPATELPHD
jgi:hypothetical protein